MAMIEAAARQVLILKRASANRPSGQWNDDDFDVLADGVVVGRIMKAAAPDDDPSTRLYRKLTEQEDAQRNRVKATSFDLNDARKRLDTLMAPKKVNGTGDIKVSVRPARTRAGASSVLRKIPLNRFISGEKAETGRQAPPAATGENHDPSLDS
jgi:hypothetical protein